MNVVGKFWSGCMTGVLSGNARLVELLIAVIIKDSTFGLFLLKARG
jgi:hypothetical protein